MDASQLNRAGAALTEDEAAIAVGILGGAASVRLAVIDPSGSTRTVTISADSVQLTDGADEDATVVVTLAPSTSSALDQAAASPAGVVASGHAKVAGTASLLAKAHALLASVLARAAA